MPKRKLILLLILFIIAGGAIFLIGTKPLKEKNVPPEEKIIQKEYLPSKRAETFYITGKQKFPKFFKEIIIDPSINVKEGEEQFLLIWVEDPQGVKKVTAKIFPAEREELIELKLIEGTKEKGKWMGSWITKDISAGGIYRLVFEATNKEDKTNQLTFFWLNRE